jgi:hypothetical protein
MFHNSTKQLTKLFCIPSAFAFWKADTVSAVNFHVYRFFSNSPLSFTKCGECIVTVERVILILVACSLCSSVSGSRVRRGAQGTVTKS